MSVENAIDAPHEGARDLAYYQAVPYVLVLESVERLGQWVRRAEHPELPGCAVEAPSALEAIDGLERERLRVLGELWERGAEIPVPRPPLRAAATRGDIGARQPQSSPGGTR